MSRRYPSEVRRQEIEIEDTLADIEAAVEIAERGDAEDDESEGEGKGEAP